MTNSLRILGIDYGGKRTGLAISDPTATIATSLDPLVGHPDQAIKEILRIVEDYHVELIVLGSPVRLNGEEHELHGRIQGLAEKLTKQSGVEVILWDERFTSSIAVRTMVDAGVSKSKRREKERVDQISALVILQEFLSSRKFMDWKNSRTR